MKKEKTIIILFLKYVVKVLMGAVDDWFDTLDERRVNNAGPSSRRSSKAKKKQSCTIS